jgi:hypothetical protein
MRLTQKSENGILDLDVMNPIYEYAFGKLSLIKDSKLTTT